MIDTGLEIYVNMRSPLKKSVFPVQRVAEIMASQAATKSFFFRFFFVVCKKIVKNNIEKKNC